MRIGKIFARWHLAITIASLHVIDQTLEAPVVVCETYFEAAVQAVRQTVRATKAEEFLLASLRLMANQIEAFAQLNWERVGCHRSMYQKSPLSNYLYLSTAQFNDTAFQTRNIKRETPVDVVILFLFP